MTQKLREGGRIVGVAVAIATGVNVDGQRGMLGFESSRPSRPRRRRLVCPFSVASPPDLSGTVHVVSDADAGLVDAVHSVLLSATWRRYRTHFMRNLC